MKRALWFVTKKVLSTTMIVCALVQGVCAREPNAVELGLDAAVGGVWVNLTNARLAVGMPEQDLRIGVFATEFLQVEPSISFALTSTQVNTQRPLSGVEEGRTTNYAIGFGVGLAAHLSKDWTSPIPFVKLEPALLVVAQPSPTAQFAVEVGGGVKLPLGTSWAGRIELDASYAFEREGKLADVAVISLRFGFSYFTK